MNGRPRYNVEISPVRDIILRGSADLSFWAERLEREDLVPLGDGGKAQLLLIAVDAKFMGVRFRELSVAVSLEASGGTDGHDAVYLPQAFNSVRLFAFVERTFYHTPYYPARIRVETRLPAAFEVSLAEGVILRAEMSADSTSATRKPTRLQEESWEGPIFLPSSPRQQDPKVFFARLAGHTHAYPFAARDTITLKPTSRAPIVEWLAESEFSPQEWAIRETATHARTKSVGRSSVPLSPAGQAG
ncbi:MAG: hypothetical protein WD063_05475 [Pirellulales bacterium]